MAGLNRIQPPSDGVNILSVGACDSVSGNWSKADYSCIGPGRCPGLVKPDGLTFGGSNQEPFKLVGRNGNVRGSQGTSFATPLALRSAVSVKAQLGNRMNALAIRALLIHRADCADNAKIDVGWGRFETDPSWLITCNDDEATIIYVGELPIDEELRAPVPIVDGLRGYVTITATLVIAPEVDPEYPGTYTRSGLDVYFRPHDNKFTQYDDGTISKHPKTVPFFSETNMFGSPEFILREETCKWEPCRKHSRRFLASSLSNPCFDIKYHQRQAGRPTSDVRPIRYAFVVSIEAPRIPDLYNRVVRAYANILVPMQPRLRIPIQAYTSDTK